MRQARAIALTFVLALGVKAADPAPNTLTADERAAGWILLFDGKTMNGWRDPRRMEPPGDAWTIADGAIQAVAKPRIVEDLFTEENWRDFEFQWDWRISRAGNSGVKYRIQKTVWLTGEHPKLPGFEQEVEWFVQHPAPERPVRGQNYVIGFEYQMIDNKLNEDALAGKSHSTAALYDMVAPTEDATKPAGEWNHSVLKVDGDHTVHWLNGVKVVDTSLAPADIQPLLQKRWGKTPGVFSLLGDQPRRDCPISLQNHDAATWFRNLKIRRLL